jgi:hypothetical protein
MPEPVFMKLYMYIMAPEPVRTAYFINASQQVLYLCIPIVARQRLSTHVSMVTNTDNSRKVTECVCLWVCLCIPLSLLGNGSVKTPSVATKNC